MSEIPALRRDDQEIKDILGYIVSLRPKWISRDPVSKWTVEARKTAQQLGVLLLQKTKIQVLAPTLCSLHLPVTPALGNPRHPTLPPQWTLYSHAQTQPQTDFFFLSLFFFKRRKKQDLVIYLIKYQNTHVRVVMSPKRQPSDGYQI